MDSNLVAENSNEPRLMEIESALQMVDHSALVRKGIYFNTQQGRRWINDAFQTKIEEIEAELRTVVSLVTRGSPVDRISTR